MGVRGIARDLAACDFGDLKELKKTKLNKKVKHNVKVKIEKDKNQACYVFGSCIIRNINNTESPGWLKNRILALGLRPISAVVDITNYVMFDLNRPLHAYDLDKIKNRIIVRNSKKGEILKALDNNNYTLDENMCVIADDEGPLGLGGIIGGKRSGTEFSTKNILLESAYFLPRSIRKTSKKLNIDTDAKFRFERGIDPLSIEEGLLKASKLIKQICGGETSSLDVKKIENHINTKINFDPFLFEKTTGFNIENKELIKILENLGFNLSKNKKFLKLTVPSWRPDITQSIDIVEEIVRIKGYEHINTTEPVKTRLKPTLNYYQKLFHFLQRSVASKGYLETVTGSFTDSKINQMFRENDKEIPIINPISSDLNVLRNSIFPNLLFYLKKNLDRGFKDISLFEIGPVFKGKKPGDQLTVIGAVRAGKVSRLNWNDKELSLIHI